MFPTPIYVSHYMIVFKIESNMIMRPQITLYELSLKHHKDEIAMNDETL